ncbi:MAG: xenobiotic (desulfurization)monooxygenase subunit A, NtaA/SnaA/SoxA/DszA family protein [Rhodospirillaceae bacterium]
MPLEGGMAILSAHADYDLSKIDLEAPMADRTEPELQRLKSRFRKPSGESLTLREVAQRHGQSVGLPQFVGTPTSIADQMEAFLQEAGGDGFMLSPIYCPGAIEEFVDLVVPELQRRGLVRKEYRGHTMRDLLRQEA